VAFSAKVLCSAALPCCVGGREREWKALPPSWKQFMVGLLLWGWAQGVGVATAASEMTRRCATSAARCAMNRRMSPGDTLASHRDGCTCGDEFGSLADSFAAGAPPPKPDQILLTPPAPAA
jgi:hypothetical protein